jgi:hypothetical protein
MKQGPDIKTFARPRFPYVPYEAFVSVLSVMVIKRITVIENRNRKPRCRRFQKLRITTSKCQRCVFNEFNS